VSLPVPLLPDASEASQVIATLRQIDYSVTSCADRLGVDPLLGVRFHDTAARSLEEPVNAAIALLLQHASIPQGQARELLGAETFAVLVRSGLLQVESHNVCSPFCLFPCADVYIATDRLERVPGINQVMYLYPESYILAGIVERRPRKQALDLCTGSGVHALLAASHCEHVVGVDVNPRAVAFCEFNRRLNGIDNVEFVEGDLYGPVAGRRFDLIVANPPYNPVDDSPAGTNYWSGGRLGTEILSRVVRGLSGALEPEGIAHIFSLFPNAAGTTTLHTLAAWLDGSAGEFDVLTTTVPDSNQPIVDGIDTYELGLAHLRRARHTGTHEAWAAPGGQFARDGAFGLSIGHDLMTRVLNRVDDAGARASYAGTPQRHG